MPAPRRRTPTTTAEYRALESEKGFQARVITTAEALGWRVWHAADSRRDIGGGRLVGDTRFKDFPDLFMAHPKKARLIFAELKREGEEPRGGQQDVIAVLNSIGSVVNDCGAVIARVWHPSDWDAIEWELKR